MRAWSAEDQVGEPRPVGTYDDFCVIEQVDLIAETEILQKHAFKACTFKDPEHLVLVGDDSWAVQNQRANTRRLADDRLRCAGRKDRRRNSPAQGGE